MCHSSCSLSALLICLNAPTISRVFGVRRGEQLGTGVKDFFYEPAEGLMKSPTAFGKGVVKGSMSLVGNTTSGVLGFTTKIT